MKFLSMLCFAAAILVFPDSVRSHPKPSSDCWKCDVKYCWDEVTDTPCPTITCPWEWVDVPGDPSTRVKKWFCKVNGMEFEALVVEGGETYDECEQNGAGLIRTGHSSVTVVCGVFHKCDCDNAHMCTLGAPLGVPGITREADEFTTVEYTVCVYVEATPPPN